MSVSAGLGRPVVLVGLGGVAGTLARYGVSLVIPEADGWPLATLLVNVAGAFALGLLLERLARPDGGSRSRRTLRLLVGTGFLGSFTTYSSLAVETERLLRAGSVDTALGYVAASLGCGLAGCLVGVVAGSLGAGRRGRPARGRVRA